ncbi:MAG: hypothetical protein R3E66_09105 [bacterium]
MRHCRFIGVLLLVAASAACGGDDAPATTPTADVGVDTTPEFDAGMDGGEDQGLPDVATPLQPTSVETDVVSTILSAGDPVAASCRVLDQFGEEFEADFDFTIAYAPQDSFLGTGADVIAARVGTGTVRCGLNAYGLVDSTPVELEIRPGRPNTVVTQVDSYHVTAGDSLDATCEVFDAYGNAILDAEPQIQTAPSERVSIQGASVTFELAGVYDVACQVDGADVKQSKVVEVVPGLPAALAIAVVPNQAVYAVGQVVQVAYVVTDAFGNVVPDANVVVTSDPQGQSFGAGRFRYGQEGTYTLSVDVAGPTLQNVRLHEEATIVVNSDGPSIECGTPADGAMVDVAPGTQVSFTGRVGDANGVSQVLVNGQAVAVSSDGSFASAVNVNWGINFVELVARDTFGEENSRYCAFLASDDWKPEGVLSYLDNGVLMLLKSAAIDDNNRADLDSLADILDRVLNSQGLRNSLHASLLNANPLKPSTCDQNVCVPLVGCACVLRSEVTYLDTQINGPNTTSMSLVTGGLRVQASVKDVRVRVRVKGQVSGIPYDTTGWVTVSSLDIDLILNITSSAGRPKATVRSVSTQVGSVSTSFNGLDGGIVNIVVSLFNGTVRNLIRDSIEGFVRDNFNGILDGVFGSLDISSLGTSFAVPKLDGNGQVTLNFGVNLTGLDVNTSRARFGLGTRIRPQAVAVAAPSLGTALPPQPLSLEPSGTQPVVVGVYVAILNQALHSLWRGGFLNATLGSSFAGQGLPAGLSATIEGLLPPVVENIAGNRVRLSIGAMRLNLVYPGIFDQGLPITLGATATTSVSVQNDALQFGVVTLENLYFSTEAVSLDANTRAIVESFLSGLVQNIVNASLNNALPQLPIPSFTLPASLSQFGLPANATLTIATTSTAQTSAQYLLRGNFAIR